MRYLFNLTTLPSTYFSLIKIPNLSLKDKSYGIIVSYNFLKGGIFYGKG
jgi:hypothetical protein